MSGRKGFPLSAAALERAMPDVPLQITYCVNAPENSETIKPFAAGCVPRKLHIALEALKEPCTVEVYTDSEYLKNGITQ